MSGGGKKVTIRDVARRAGVSPTSVSLVLSGKAASLPEATRERVRRAAQELDYRADLLARSLVTRRTNIIGIVVPDLTNPFFAEAVRHIQPALAERGYDVILCNSEERAENDLRYIRLLAGRSVDGLLLAPSAEAFTELYSRTLRKLLGELGIPYLFFDRYFEDEPRVAVDNEGSSLLAARYLMEQGHEKIGVITGPLSLNSSRNRLAGVRRAYAERGLCLRSEWVYEGKYDIATGSAGCAELLGRGVSAVFAFSDMQAYGVYAGARRAGRRIPDDLSVMGFDDSVFSSVLEVPLTTMRQPVRQIAEEACRVLLARVESGETLRPQNFAAQLVLGKSVVALPHEREREKSSQ